MVKIIQISKGKQKQEITRDILHQLPEWFSIESAIRDYISKVKSQLFFAAKDKSQVIGFISLNENNQFTAEIEVMGILKDYQSKGIGGSLLLTAEKALKKKKIKYLLVKTLAEKKKDKYYDKTRKFYLKTGFIQILESEKIWGKKNPCVVMIKNL